MSSAPGTPATAMAVKPTMTVTIDHAICNACGICREVCPEFAIHPKYLEIRHFYEVNPQRCTGCGECLAYCPAPGALVQSE